LITSFNKEATDFTPTAIEDACLKIPQA